MPDQHPITPPPELVREWLKTHYSNLPGQIAEPSDSALHIATQAARWGADQELAACCEWLDWQQLAKHRDLIPSLSAARRPKQPSLREEALAELDAAVLRGDCITTSAATPLLRRALGLVPEGPAVTPAADDRGPGSVADIVNATDEELNDLYEDAGGVMSVAFRAIYDLGYEHGSQDIEAIEGAPVPPDAAAPDRPLWELMRKAYLSDDNRTVAADHAAELRVVADWLESKWPQGPDMHPCICAAWLRAEAERAVEGVQ